MSFREVKLANRVASSVLQTKFLSEDVEELLMEQVGNEFASDYIYVHGGLAR
jgi:hypothetical protein